VHAEGGASKTGAGSIESGDAALVCDVRATAPRRGWAFERFLDQGPLALLPLPGATNADGYTVVWCDSRERCEARCALDDGAFTGALCDAFGERMGTLEPITRRVTVALPRHRRERLHEGTHVWIGNAAQTLHPVAGQGLNLGIRDAYELATMVAESFTRGRGIEESLAEYARGRMLDRRSMASLTEALATKLNSPLLRPLQSVALGVLDASPAVRNTIARGFVHGLARA
jgi:2-octaprenyl-6-methoxyphenol hydroxylase